MKRLPIFDSTLLESRRGFLRGVATSALAIVPVAALGCGQPLVCTDVAGLSADEQEQRRNAAYKDASPEPAKRCNNCAAFKPAAADKCGECTEIKGPVHPQGFCNLWRQKA
ncbi:MAG: hypothetical protein HOW73_01895 [Polyangiaceae bacterium]|nr:hypothetical protein [Polyangiaceae bacterium]